MEIQSRGLGRRSLLAVALIALLVGALGGGAAGGGLAYYLAQRAPVAVAAASQPAPQTAAQTQVMSLKQDSAIVDAVKKVKPAVVTVVNTMQATGSRARQAQALGTGVIVDAKGYIVTNNHVVEGAKQLEVLFENGSKADAQLIGTDPFSDLAVVRVTGRAMPAVATLGDSAVLQVGEPVIAIGSALGDFKNTVTVGVVSGLNRRLGANDASAIEGLIQTDAAINHGNSGGPLLNAAGQVVGINTLVVRNDGGGDVAEGLGFAIPVNLVKTVSGQLIARGKVTRPFLGVSYVPLNPQLAAANDLSVKAGAWVQEVTAGSPAARAGLKAGDVLTAIGDQTLDDDTPLVSALIKHQPGETVPLTIWRGGQTLTLNVTLIERQSS
ncbi:MAG: trypsin-like peptidase domain-containing protein [Chloroflexi bacterium]|nr:trypsin-like peptidase domain-containing protein [Chloroflexota bacterium]